MTGKKQKVADSNRRNPRNKSDPDRDTGASHRLDEKQRKKGLVRRKY
jgi:hypothetical protein